MDEPKKIDDRSGDAPPGEARGRQDLSFLWPVIDRISAVEIKFNGDAASEAASSGASATNGIESRLATLEAEIAAIKQVLQSGVTVLAVSTDGTSAAAPAPAERAEYPPRSWLSISCAAAVSVPALLLAHWLIVFVYDLRTIILLLASMLVPLTVAIAFTLRRRILLRFEIVVAVLIGLLAVSGMSYITSAVEKTPLLPQNLREALETLEYIASISLAYFTGVLISNAWQNRFGSRQARVGAATLRVAKTFARATGQAIETGTKVSKQVKSIHDLINTAMPVGTAVVSVIAGVDSVLK